MGMAESKVARDAWTRALIPLAIAVLLLGAWACRWEKGPTKSDSGGIIVFYRDRWTNRTWVRIYSLSTVEVIFGPAFSTAASADQRAQDYWAAVNSNTALTVAWGAAFTVSAWVGAIRLRKAVRDPDRGPS